MPADDLHVVVLAGGAGARLGGVRKADLRIGGATLLVRVKAALPASPHPVLVATGPAGMPQPHVPPGAVAIPDPAAEHHGPVAGLAAAVATLADRGVTTGLLLSVAVDTPFLPVDYAARLTAALGSEAAAVAHWRGNPYPTNALWRLESLAPLLPTARSPRELLSRLEAVAVQWDGDLDPFANLNTLADLLALQRRARG